VRLAFACPYYGPTPPRVVSSQLSAVMHAAWEHPFVANVGTERTGHVAACEQILKSAIDNPRIDALFWTEHDCVLPLDAISRLVKVLEDHPEADAASGITFMRYKPYHPMIANYVGVLTQEILDQDRPVMVMNRVGTEPVVGKEHFRFVTRIDTRDQPFAVDATSMNCLLLRRSALEAMTAIPHPFDTDPDGWTTPDFALFARLMGKVRLLVDPAVLTIHLGDPEPIGFDRWVAEMEAMVKRGEAEREEVAP
jgi:hypothetical protein